MLTAIAVERSSLSVVALCAGVIATALVGCANPPLAAAECRAAVAPPGVQLEFIGATNSPMAARLPGNNTLLIAPSLGSSVAVPLAELGRSPTGNAALRLDIVNCGDTTLWVRVRTQFIGPQGQLTEPRSAWKDLQILPRSFTPYEEMGLQRASVAFRTEIDRIQPP